MAEMTATEAIGLLEGRGSFEEHDDGEKYGHFKWSITENSERVSGEPTWNLIATWEPGDPAEGEPIRQRFYFTITPGGVDQDAD